MSTRRFKRGLWFLEFTLPLALLGFLLIGVAAASGDVTELGRIEIAPNTVTLNLDERQQFEANGFDLSGRSIPIQAQWSATGGSIDSETGLYTATTAGDFTVTASVRGSTVTGTASVHVGPPTLATIRVTPTDAQLDPGGVQTFTAVGYDGQSNEIPIDPVWTATGGTITSEGRYTAGTRPGIFRITASAKGSSVRGHAMAWVVIRPLSLVRITVSPTTAQLNPGGVQTFTAQGYDDQDNEVPIDPVWTASGGTITTGGLYTAATAGDFTVNASVQGTTVNGTASVHVNRPPLATIEVTPTEVNMDLGGQQQFRAAGYDHQGGEIPIDPVWTASGGTITTGGLYTAATAGHFTVNASVQGTTVSGTASVHVTPPGPPMQTYEHPSLGSLCYPPDWAIDSVGPDRLFVTDPTGQLYAGYRLWESAMGASPGEFINSYQAQKPEGTVVDEAVPATLCGSSAITTTLRYPWGTIETITVTMLRGRPVKLFVEGPPDRVNEFVSTSYYGRMAGCCQLP